MLFRSNSIQQQLVIGNTQQKSGVSPGGKRGLQFVPRDFELRFGAFVFKTVHPRILDENVQAVDERLR